jgi:hypothetical protein
MESRFKKSEDIAILVLPGARLDMSNAQEFRQKVAPFLASNGKMVFEMGRL